MPNRKKANLQSIVFGISIITILNLSLNCQFSIANVIYNLDKSIDKADVEQLVCLIEEKFNEKVINVTSHKNLQHINLIVEFEDIKLSASKIQIRYLFLSNSNCWEDPIKIGNWYYSKYNSLLTQCTPYFKISDITIRTDYESKIKHSELEELFKGIISGGLVDIDTNKIMTIDFNKIHYVYRIRKEDYLKQRLFLKDVEYNYRTAYIFDCGTVEFCSRCHGYHTNLSGYYQIFISKSGSLRGKWITKVKETKN